MNIGCTISWRIQNDRWASYKISIGLQIPLLLWLTGFSTLLGQIGFPTEVRPKSLFGFFGRSLTQCRALTKIKSERYDNRHTPHGRSHPILFTNRDKSPVPGISIFSW